MRLRRYWPGCGGLSTWETDAGLAAATGDNGQLPRSTPISPAIPPRPAMPLPGRCSPRAPILVSPGGTHLELRAVQLEDVALVVGARCCSALWRTPYWMSAASVSPCLSSCSAGEWTHPARCVGSSPCFSMKRLSSSVTFLVLMCFTSAMPHFQVSWQSPSASCIDRLAIRS